MDVLAALLDEDAARDLLIANKRATGRTKDIADVETLLARDES